MPTPTDLDRNRPHRDAELIDVLVVGDGSESPVMSTVRQAVRRAAECRATVLVSGEAGVGKQSVARAIHRLGRCSDGRFAAVHCREARGRVLEEVLFGHVRAASAGDGPGGRSGARVGRSGALQDAVEGTLFLSAVERLAVTTQARLARVLDDGSYDRLGGGDAAPARTNARLIASTEDDLAAAVAAGRFREDLFWRLNVIPIAVPPLRQRREDIPALLTLLLDHYNRIHDRYVAHIDPAVFAAMQAYHWPGNLSELRSYVERAVVMSKTDEFTIDALPFCVVENDRSTAKSLQDADVATLTREVVAQGIAESGDSDGQIHARVVDQVERELIAQVLDACGGIQTKTATRLGMNRNTLYKKIKQYGLDGPDGKASDGKPSDRKPRRSQSNGSSTRGK